MKPIVINRNYLVVRLIADCGPIRRPLATWYSTSSVVIRIGITIAYFPSPPPDFHRQFDRVINAYCVCFTAFNPFWNIPVCKIER